MRTRCIAKAKSTGRRCARAPIAGATVCRVHGGAAPQVQQSARERIVAAQHPAIDALLRALRCNDWGAVVRAARDLLDRAGLAAPKTVILEDERRPDHSWLTDDELDQVEAIFARAEARKLSGEPSPGDRAHAPMLNGAHVIALDGADDDDVDEVVL